jgi:hypothetical protein
LPFPDTACLIRAEARVTAGAATRSEPATSSHPAPSPRPRPPSRCANDREPPPLGARRHLRRRPVPAAQGPWREKHGQLAASALALLHCPQSRDISRFDGLVAQLDRALDYESRGRGFESSRVRHFPEVPMGHKCAQNGGFACAPLSSAFVVNGRISGKPMILQISATNKARPLSLNVIFRPTFRRRAATFNEAPGRPLLADRRARTPARRARSG